MLHNVTGKTLLLTLLASLSGFGQSSPRPTVNGKTLTDGQMEFLLELAPAELKPTLAKDPKELLRFYGFIDRMSDLADKQHLDEDPVVKEQLALARKQILTNELMKRYGADHPPSAEEEQEYYAAHLADFTSALVKTVFLPAAETAQKKADALYRDIAAGVDFGALAGKYPVEGFSNVIGQGDASVPQTIRSAVFALKPGGVTQPISLANGIYLLQMQSVGVKSLADARSEIYQRLSTERFLAWIEGVRKSVLVEPPSQ